MNRSIALIAALALAAGLTGCSSQSHDTATNVSEPGTSVTHAPAAPDQRGPRCRDHLVCPR